MSSKQINIIYIQKKIKLKWLLTGLPDDTRTKNIVAKMYGFQYYPVGGCVVSKKLRDSVNLVNKTTNEILVKKFGITGYENLTIELNILKKKCVPIISLSLPFSSPALPALSLFFLVQAVCVRVPAYEG